MTAGEQTEGTAQTAAATRRAAAATTGNPGETQVRGRTASAPNKSTTAPVKADEEK